MNARAAGRMKGIMRTWMYGGVIKARVRVRVWVWVWVWAKGKVRVTVRVRHEEGRAYLDIRWCEHGCICLEC